MAFTEEEAAYLKSQPLARIATVGADDQPDVAPVGFEFDGTYFYVGGRAPERTRKYRNVQAGHARWPWSSTISCPPARGRRGLAGLRDGRADRALRPVRPGAYLRITPEISWSWNLEGRPYGDEALQSGPRRTVHR